MVIGQPGLQGKVQARPACSVVRLYLKTLKTNVLNEQTEESHYYTGAVFYLSGSRTILIPKLPSTDEDAA